MMKMKKQDKKATGFVEIVIITILSIGLLIALILFFMKSSIFN